uniref:MYND-type domain-containing protein n=1 Tax=Leptocylindrus danicus TaxID=163516 RepID=A0A7S2JTV1_9STRA|mmetsp:Transcript_11521/g.17432  ORF Transcript_11521/g.17432 Transcript_11521/m.17432 type:complete len:291 (+) Transcript_11521:87-959(+)
MALFFDPEETTPQFMYNEESRKDMEEHFVKPMRVLSVEIMQKYVDIKVAPRHVIGQVEDIVNTFFSEKEDIRACMKVAFSDEAVDKNLAVEDNGDSTASGIPLACCALFLISKLIEYQSVYSGGKSVIDCLEKTVKAGDKLFELWQRICTRHPDRAEKIKEASLHFLSVAPYPYMQVGDKRRFVQRLRFKEMEREKIGDDYGVPLHYGNLSDEEIWHIYRKSEYSDRFPLACMNCGKFEHKNGKKHNRCSACESALYCSKECQKLHWKEHKADCRANSTARSKLSRNMGL